MVIPSCGEAIAAGDPWTPIDSAAAKPLTVDADGFHYRRVVNLLDRGKFRYAPLQEFEGTETRDGAEIVFVVTVRGQGETQGFHERRILVPPRAVPFAMCSAPTPRLATLAREHVDDASKLSGKALRPALFTLLQGAPEKPDYNDPKAKAKADTFIRRFEQLVDADFFEHLFAELPETAHSDAAKGKRRAWIEELGQRARDILAIAESGSPLSQVHRYRARAKARSVLSDAIECQFKDLFGGAP